MYFTAKELNYQACQIGLCVKIIFFVMDILNHFDWCYKRSPAVMYTIKEKIYELSALDKTEVCQWYVSNQYFIFSHKIRGLLLGGL